MNLSKERKNYKNKWKQYRKRQNAWKIQKRIN